MRIGVISDTHGTVHPMVFRIFEGADHVLHAGDLGSEEVLIDLRSLAPVTAIHGNADSLELQTRYPCEASATLNGVNLLIKHQVLERNRLVRSIRNEAKSKGAAAVIFGHSHVPFSQLVDGILFFNPGGGGKKRFSLPRSVGLLDILDDGTIHPTLFRLDP